MKRICFLLLMTLVPIFTFASNPKESNLIAEKINPLGSAPADNQPDNTLTPKEQKEGWKLLWDGKTLNGWVSNKDGVVPQKGWTIKDSELIVDFGGNKGGGDLVTEKEFKNFILEVDFKLTPGANSGIKYFIQPYKSGKGFSNVGCEYQVLDDVLHPDAKLGINGCRTLASLYDLIPADKAKPFNGVNQWNHARIEVRGEKVAHYLNGTKVVEYVRGTPEWKAVVATSKFAKEKGFGEYATGHFLLQEHGNEVHYKNIKVKELK
jgi:hypothetical protein